MRGLELKFVIWDEFLTLSKSDTKKLSSLNINNIIRHKRKKMRYSYWIYNKSGKERRCPTCRKLEEWFEDRNEWLFVLNRGYMTWFCGEDAEKLIDGSYRDPCPTCEKREKKKFKLRLW